MESSSSSCTSYPDKLSSRLSQSFSSSKHKLDKSIKEKSFQKGLDSPFHQNSLNCTNNNSIDESTVSDESMKSHFLALYDECFESETVSQLKADIESLKYDNSLKDQKINLLKEKIEIKDLTILSLKDEITLVKTDDGESTVSNNSRSNICLNYSSQLYPNSQVKEHIDSQTSPLKFVNDVIIDGQTIIKCTSVNQKECQTSPLKSEESYCQTDSDISIKNSTECMTSPVKCLKNPVLHKICQTELNNSVKSVKDSLTSPLKFDNVHKLCQTSFSSPVRGIKECQTSPLKVEKKINVHETCQTDFNSPPKSIKECQTSPIKFETKNHMYDVSQICFNTPLNTIEDSKAVEAEYTNIKCCKCSGIITSDDVNAIPSKLEKHSNTGTKFGLEQELKALNERIMTLEFNIKEKEEYTELLCSQLDLKNEEVISLSLKLSETKLEFDKINYDFSKLSEGISSVKQSLEQLTFMCDMLNNIESEKEFAKLKELSEMQSSSQYSIPLHDITLIQDMVLKLRSHMEGNASKVIDLSAKIKTVENELFAIQIQNKEQLHHMPLDKLSKCTQTESVGSIESNKIITDNENEELVSQLKKEIMFYEKKNKELEKCNEEFKHKINSLETKFQTAESEWNIKTIKLVSDLEEKYDKELNDQDNKFTEDLCNRLQDMKQQHLKRILEQEEEFKEIISRLKSSHSEKLLQIQKQIKDLEDQLLTKSVEKENLRHQLDKEKEQEIIIIRKKCEEVVQKYKERMWGYKNEISQLKYQLKLYIDETDKLKKRNVLDKDEPISEQSKEKIKEISSERDLLYKKYTLAKQHIDELKEELKKKIKHLSDKEELLQKLNCNAAKETEETNKKLLYELDQKKAKIMSLESNNANLIVELKKLKDMLSSKNTMSCKMNTRGSKTDIPARSENCYEKVRQLQV